MAMRRSSKMSTRLHAQSCRHLGRARWAATATALAFVATVVLYPITGAVAAPTTTSHDDWPMFHNDPLHGGVSTDPAIGASSASSLTKQWAKPVGGGAHGTAAVLASPAVVYNATLNETLVYDVSSKGE